MRRAVLPAILIAAAACAPRPDSAPSAASAPAPTAPTSVTLALPDGFAVFAQLALDDASRQHGLMGVSQVPPGQGMLFVFPRPFPARFWMKNCLTPIDMVFADTDGRVLHVENAAPVCTADPCPTYGPEGDATVRVVLELGPGEAAAHGFKPGAILALPDRDALYAAAH